MQLIDSHCHLDFPEFDRDRDELIESCKQQGITRLIVPGVTAATWQRLQQITACYTECIPVYGLHPYYIEEHESSDIEALKKVLKIQQPIAIGEIGLDYYLKDLDKKKQQDFFHAQLGLAHDFNLPVIMHVRKAHDDTLLALREHKVNGGIVHAFNGSLQQAKQYIELGFKFGFGGALTFDNAKHLRKLAQDLPLDSIVLETDSPDMRPANYKPSRNTPLTIHLVLYTLSKLRSESKDQIVKQTSDNVVNLFHLI